MSAVEKVGLLLYVAATSLYGPGLSSVELFIVLALTGLGWFLFFTGGDNEGNKRS